MSTFKELYDDFEIRTRTYTATLPFTPGLFMRIFVKGLGIFQRETYLAENVRVVQQDNMGRFHLPEDCLLLKQVQDISGVNLVSQSIEQFMRNAAKSYDGEIIHLDIDRYRTYSSKSSVRRRIFAVREREIVIFPRWTDTEIYVHYHPLVEPFSKRSPQWQLWFEDAAQFDQMFNNGSLASEFAQYEDALVQYVVADIYRSAKDETYALYENFFFSEIARAKLNKPQYFKRGYADYTYSPWR